MFSILKPPSSVKAIRDCPGYERLGLSVLAGIQNAAHEQDRAGGLIAQEIEEGLVCP